ncbi:MAG: hypothetical protein GY805_39485 [Chloroflexi bacterium]|nr:hypothetical protein [Chloroflexota bacterium]
MKTPSTAANQIAAWLSTHLSKEGYPARTFYGEAFTLWLGHQFPTAFADQIPQLQRAALKQLARTDINAHPEFNLFAILNYCRDSQTDVKSLIPTFPVLRNTPSSNWLLLGTLNRLLWNHLTKSNHFPEWRLRWHTRLLLVAQQQKDGLIRDDRLFSRWLPLPFLWAKGGRYGLHYLPRLQKLSLQYHCFSLALLIDIYQLTKWAEVKKAIQAGIAGILPFVLPNGDTLYLGRGQQQIFGYGALLYALSAVNQLFEMADCAAAWQRVWHFVSRFQRSDGSFPLVLRIGERGYPHEVNTADPQWMGWYGYNNTFDYLPFLALYLTRTQPLTENKRSAPSLATLINKRYAIIRTTHWQATIATPTGSVSHDQPIPYLCVGGDSHLPCFGGEDTPDSLYQLWMLPLPYFLDKEERWIYLRDIMRWQLQSSQDGIYLNGRCQWANFSRHYTWSNNRLSMADTLNLQSPPHPLQKAFPLVMATRTLEAAKNGRYAIGHHIYLQVVGTEGTLERVMGVSAVGSTHILREAITWQNQSQFRRQMHITWPE